MLTKQLAVPGDVVDGNIMTVEPTLDGNNPNDRHFNPDEFKQFLDNHYVGLAALSAGETTSDLSPVDDSSLDEYLNRMQQRLANLKKP